MPEQQLFDKFLARLASEFSETDPGATRGRCLSRPRLQQLLLDVRHRLGLSARDVGSGPHLLHRLVQSGLASPVPVDSPGDARDATTELYLVGLGPTIDSLHPVELLMGVEPHGIVSFFSALSYYSLTTQIPPYHHVVKLIRKTTTNARAEAARKNRKATERPRRRDALGTKQFEFHGATYYRSRRLSCLVPGTKRRYLNSYTVFRITTREQTLLDTLMAPQKCGGPAVIFEAWERGKEDLNEHSLLTLLDQIDDPELDARTSYMLEATGFEPPHDALSARFERARHALRATKRLPLTLLKGYQFTARDESGLLEVP